ncbi:LCP family protein [Pseudalkalibacillus sp. R45]|uniref:LCP family protein n=1 Tax=Pseudalkalibacillus sp. R45 TaxID=3457433 RepID=UPI003FCDA128
MNSRMKRKKRKRKSLRRVLKLFLLTSIFLVIGLVSYGGYLAYNIKSAANESYNELDRPKSDLRKEEVSMGDDPVSILLMGIEDYQGDSGRSDVMLVVTINPKTKEMVMVSIPRDTRTYIPEIGYKDKITHAYAYGKKGQQEKAVIESVEGLLDIPIDYYVSTNFNGFVDVVDELGGVDVNVPFDFKEKDMDGKYINFQKGNMHLDGREALAYVRMRKQDPRGDFGRNERQQEVLSSIMDNAISFKSVTRIDNVVTQLGDDVNTNITLNEMFGLKSFYENLKNKEFETLNIKGENTYINNVYYYAAYDESIEKVSTRLQEVLELNNEEIGDHSTSEDMNQQ